MYRYNVLGGNSIREEITKKGTRFLGYYKNGYASGTFWAGMLGGQPYAHLHGMIQDSNGTISGNNISYIYPDMETAFVGKFEDRTLRHGKHLKVSEIKCDINGIPYVHKFTKPSLADEAIYYYKAPSVNSFGAGPVGVLDPYEKDLLELRNSSIPNAGKGLFLRKNVTKNMVVSFYCGFYYDKDESRDYLLNCAHNVTKTDDERRHCFKYSVGVDYIDKWTFIPPEIDTPKTFFPTLGPKVFSVISYVYANKRFKCKFLIVGILIYLK